MPMITWARSAKAGNERVCSLSAFAGRHTGTCVSWSAETWHAASPCAAASVCRNSQSAFPKHHLISYSLPRRFVLSVCILHANCVYAWGDVNFHVWLWLCIKWRVACTTGYLCEYRLTCLLINVCACMCVNEMYNRFPYVLCPICSWRSKTWEMAER